MSLKTKLTSLITTFVLLCSLLTVGVFAVKNTTFNVGGDIVFNVQGIEATIKMDSNTGFATTNSKVIGTDILTDVEINNEMSVDQVSAEFAPWSGLELAFKEGAKIATIVLTIKNTVTGENPDNYLDITATATANTNNASISVENNAGGITALLQQDETATFTITFKVLDDGYSASLNDFSVNFEMKKRVLSDFPVLSEEMTYQTFKFTTNTDGKSMSVKDIGAQDAMNNYNSSYFQSTGSIKIPAYVNNGGTIYPVTTIHDYGFFVEPGCAAHITSASLPNTITTIGSLAFEGSNLTNLILPEGATNIGRIYGISEIACNKVSENDAGLYLGTASNPYYALVGSKTTGELNIHKDCKVIAGYALGNYTHANSVINVPDNVEYLGESIFSGGNNGIELDTIILGKGLKWFSNYDQGPFGGLVLDLGMGYNGDHDLNIYYAGTQDEWNAIENTTNPSYVQENFKITLNYNSRG